MELDDHIGIKNLKFHTVRVCGLKSAVAAYFHKHFKDWFQKKAVNSIVKNI